MQQGGPYICNWMAGRDYCGKRFTSAEELLVHLKTHTNLSASDSSLLGGGGPGSAAYANLLGASAASYWPGRHTRPAVGATSVARAKVELRECEGIAGSRGRRSRPATAAAGTVQ